MWTTRRRQMRRTVIVVCALALIVVPPAAAWTWPVNGPVLQKFTLGDDPYAAGQHRGIDIGAPAGATVSSPVSGKVAFAGTVPVSGKCVTIQTADGYSVTLTHLGSMSVQRGATVGEGDVVGTIGPSGEVEHDVPYVHLGVRRSEDPNGYVDPLLFLPLQPEPVAASSIAPTAAPAAIPPPATVPAPATAAPTASPQVAAETSVATGSPSSSFAQPAMAGTAVSKHGARGGSAVSSSGVAASPTVRPSRTRFSRRRVDARIPMPAAAVIPTATSTQTRPTGEREERTRAFGERLTTPRNDLGTASPDRTTADGTNGTRRHRGFAAWLALAALLAAGVAAAILAAKRRRARSGSRDLAPIIASNVALLPHHADLLRELDPAHRARVHDDRRRHPRPASPPARRRDLLPDRDGRERHEERTRGGGGWCRPEDVRRPARRGPLAPPARASRRDSRLLYSHD